MPCDFKNVVVEAKTLVVGYNRQSSSQVPDFTLSRGEFLCVAGPNGSGKTTLAKTVAGLLPPVSGSLAVDPGDCRSVGYVPQQSAQQKDFPASVLEVVRSGCQSLRGLRPFYSFAERRRAQRIMERLGLDKLARESFRDLSGGQRQRVLIARALVAPRRLLILDEPTSALDGDAAAEFMRIVRETVSKGAAVLMVTHDKSIMDAAGRVLRLGEAMPAEPKNAPGGKGEELADG